MHAAYIAAYIVHSSTVGRGPRSWLFSYQGGFLTRAAAAARGQPGFLISGVSYFRYFTVAWGEDRVRRGHPGSHVVFFEEDTAYIHTDLVQMKLVDQVN